MFERELEYYNAHREEWLREHKDKFALIKGDALLGFFASEEEAYEDGLRHFGNVPFLIKKVTEREQIIHLPSLTLGLINART